MSCLEAGHILSNGPKTTSLCFSQRQSHVKYRRKLNFAILQRQHMCTARFRLYKRFIWSLWWISTHTNLQICTIHLIILSIGMTLWLADIFARLAAFNLSAIFWPGFWTSPAKFCTLNIKSWQSGLKSHLCCACGPPRLLWCKCRDIFVGQLMMQH